MKNNKWSIGAKLWFAFMILGQWIMFIEYAGKPITKTHVGYQRAANIYFLFGLLGTALYLWLAISKKKEALGTIMVIAVIGALYALFKGEVSSSLLSLIAPCITYLIARKTVGFGGNTELEPDLDSESE